MKRFRETGSMLKDPSKGSSLRRDLSQGASSLKSAFKKIKDAGRSLSRGTKDLSATRVVQGPKTKELSSPTAQQAGNKLIQASQAVSTVRSRSSSRRTTASRQRALEARLKRQAEKAKEKEAAKARRDAAKSNEPKRRANESITAFRQRLAKYRRENK